MALLSTPMLLSRCIYIYTKYHVCWGLNVSTPLSSCHTFVNIAYHYHCTNLHMRHLVCSYADMAPAQVTSKSVVCNLMFLCDSSKVSKNPTGFVWWEQSCLNIWTRSGEIGGSLNLVAALFGMTSKHINFRINLTFHHCAMLATVFRDHQFNVVS